MSATYSARVGNKGRVVIPAGLRESQGWGDDTELVFVEDEDGVTMMTLDDLEGRVHNALRGSHVLEELFAERRDAACAEDGR